MDFALNPINSVKKRLCVPVYSTISVDCANGQ